MWTRPFGPSRGVPDDIPEDPNNTQGQMKSTREDPVTKRLKNLFKDLGKKFVFECLFRPLWGLLAVILFTHLLDVT